ncbi:hypothetical protein ACFFIF_10715 [Vagococcus entomophilus]|uniref:hypothetical protein n=1 Tax=Vagococcus entomophilus TaxID=1160095 RepID=UPI001FE34FCC|nr:hypothetical protein [Vagococcus entomophilus]
MEKFLLWMTDNFSPKINKIAKKGWVVAIQESILTAMPLVFIGSFATIFSIVHDYWQLFPDLSVISTFSFGLFSIFLAFLIPQAVMKQKNIAMWKSKRDWLVWPSFCWLCFQVLATRE